MYVYPVGKTPNTTVFTLIPISGTAHMLINPGFLPKEDSQYYYKAESNIAKRIVVGQADLNGMGLSNSTLYVKIVCPHSCKYILKSRQPEDQIYDIDPGYSEDGLMSKNEIRQHYLIAKHYNGLKVEKRYTIKLQLYSGEANL